MSRLMRTPLLSLALFIAWLMLNESASAGQMLLGATLALAIPRLTAHLWPDKPHPRRLGAMWRLAGRVLIDIVRSNIAVARLILGRESEIQPRFVWVPLALSDPYGIAALASIVTMTPGTLSADISDDRRYLLVHAFDVDDDAAQAALIADIKSRYELPLQLIFERHRAS